jgi:protein arginine N-methyltransferase 1
VARETARANGLEDAITFIEGRSTDVSLPEKADVVVSDLRGLLPFYGGHLEAVIDARERLLAPGGTLIGRRDVVRIALVDSRRDYDRVDAWRAQARGFDLEAARHYAANSWWKARSASPDDLLSEPARLLTLDYESIDGPNASGEARMTVGRSGSAHGLCVWFDAELTPGTGFTNAPGAPDLVYGRSFFPLLEPVDVATGDVVEASFSASLVDGRYLFAWETAIGSADVVRAHFKQSTLRSFPLSSRLLHASMESSTPTLTAEGGVARDVLRLMDGYRSLGEIADVLSLDAGSRQEALRFAASLAHRYGRI